MKTHGDYGSREYIRWASMMTRCYNTKANAYSGYGGRGIRVCRRWWKYENFLADMGRAPTTKHQLERIDNSKGYSPANVRWATALEQGQNKRNNVVLEIHGECLTMSAWARRTGIPVGTLWDRIRANWPPQRLLQPPQHGRPKNCKNGHDLEKHGRWEGQSRRCVLCKQIYDHNYRQRK